MMAVRVLSLGGGYVAPWSHCASWSCQRTHHHYISLFEIIRFGLTRKNVRNLVGYEDLMSTLIGPTFR